MEKKICIKCKEEVDMINFVVRYKKESRIVYKNICKLCDSVRIRKNYILNSETIKARSRKWRAENKEISRIRQKEYIAKNKEKIKEKKAIYYQKNKKTIHAKAIERRNKNPEKTVKWWKEWRLKNIEKLKIKNKKYWDKKTKNDKLFPIKNALRLSILNKLKSKCVVKNKRTNEILGCTYELAKSSIERQFKKGMTWDNHGNGEGKWHIDHIIPLASAKTEEDVYRLCHYTNLQPLWSKENLSKGKKIIPTQIKLTF